MAANKILVAYDESEVAGRALKMAADLALHNPDAHVDVVYVIPIPLLDESWLVVVPAEQATPSTLADLARATWIDLAPGTAGAFALDRLERQLGVPLTTRHVAYDYDVVLAMVSQGLGHALMPELAVVSGRVPDGVSLARLPGLGARQIVVRHRRTRSDPGPATRAVLDELLIRAAALGLG